MKSATALKAKSRNLSALTGTPPYIIQRNFLFERFLERASVSEYRESFIVKGGILLASLVGIDLRATMDLDATIKGRDLAQSEITEIINRIIAVKIDDAAEFTLVIVERTRVEADYPGWRISLNATFDKLRDTLKIDVTVGDVITPRAIEYDYKLMFEDRTIPVLDYNTETILAEKLTAVLLRTALQRHIQRLWKSYQSDAPYAKGTEFAEPVAA